MQANIEKGSALARAKHLQIVLNFCRTVVRSDVERLQLAMSQYAQFLATQERSWDRHHG